MNENDLFVTSDYDLKRNVNNKDDPYFGEKIGHEVHRLMGLLRFSPDEDGVYVALCAPDYYVLPALGAYFSVRFGDTPWKIIDEKRGLCLGKKKGEPLKLEKTENEGTEKPPDNWEELWKHYHKTINNDSRDNPRLQRQFMPERYWKYLPEIGSKN